MLSKALMHVFNLSILVLHTLGIRIDVDRLTTDSGLTSAPSANSQTSWICGAQKLDYERT